MDSFPLPETGLTCGQIGASPVAFKWGKQALGINHFLLMQKVLHSRVPAGKGEQCRGGGGMCAQPLQIFGVTYHTEGASCAQTAGSFRTLHLLPWVLGLFLMAAAKAEPQRCRLLTSRGWWEKTSLTCVARGGLGGPPGPQPRSSKMGGLDSAECCCVSVSNWGEETAGLDERQSSSPGSGSPQICTSKEPHLWSEGSLCAPWPGLAAAARAWGSWGMLSLQEWGQTFPVSCAHVQSFSQEPWQMLEGAAELPFPRARAPEPGMCNLERGLGSTW